MSDRAQIAALGERFDRERTRLAFDGCMRMTFPWRPAGSMAPSHSVASFMAEALPALLAFQHALGKLRGGK